MNKKATVVPWITLLGVIALLLLGGYQLSKTSEELKECELFNEQISNLIKEDANQLIKEADELKKVDLSKINSEQENKIRDILALRYHLADELEIENIPGAFTLSRKLKSELVTIHLSFSLGSIIPNTIPLLNEGQETTSGRFPSQ